MSRLLSRFSDWVVLHPVLWGVGSGAVLVLLGFALDLTPLVVVAAGAVIGALNILHARRRGYCPRPAGPLVEEGALAPVSKPSQEISETFVDKGF